MRWNWEYFWSSSYQGFNGKSLGATRFAQSGSLGRGCFIHTFPPWSTQETQHLEQNYINKLSNITILSINHMRKLTKYIPDHLHMIVYSVSLLSVWEPFKFSNFILRLMTSGWRQCHHNLYLSQRYKASTDKINASFCHLDSCKKWQLS